MPSRPWYGSSTPRFLRTDWVRRGMYSQVPVLRGTVTAMKGQRSCSLDGCPTGVTSQLQGGPESRGDSGHHHVQTLCPATPPRASGPEGLITCLCLQAASAWGDGYSQGSGGSSVPWGARKKRSIFPQKSPVLSLAPTSFPESPLAGPAFPPTSCSRVPRGAPSVTCTGKTWALD